MMLEYLLQFYILILVIVGTICKPICVIDDYDGSLYVSLGLRSFYFWFIKAKYNDEITVFGLILIFILETLLIPANIIMVIISALADLFSLLCIKKKKS